MVKSQMEKSNKEFRSWKILTGKFLSSVKAKYVIEPLYKYIDYFVLHMLPLSFFILKLEARC